MPGIGHAFVPVMRAIHHQEGQCVGSRDLVAGSAGLQHRARSRHRPPSRQATGDAAAFQDRCSMPPPHAIALG